MKTKQIWLLRQLTGTNYLGGPGHFCERWNPNLRIDTDLGDPLFQMLHFTDNKTNIQ